MASSSLLPHKPHELLKSGLNDTVAGSGVFLDSAKHLTKVNRITLQGGLTMSNQGLKNVKHLEADQVTTKKLVAPNTLQCLVAQPDHVPRFADTPGSLLSSAVKVDADGHVSGVNSLTCLQVTAATSVATDQLSAHSVKTNQLCWSLALHETALEWKMSSTAGLLQPTGISGVGFYVWQLEITSAGKEEIEWQIYGQLSVGLRKSTGKYRGSFGGALGGVKAKYVSEHESERGYDYICVSLPEIGKVSLGVEQKTGELHLRSEQQDTKMTLRVKKTV